jgi:hypothetical protein
MCPGETITIKPLITFTHPGAELDLKPDGEKMSRGHPVDGRIAEWN